MGVKCDGAREEMDGGYFRFYREFYFFWVSRVFSVRLVFSRSYYRILDIGRILYIV